MSLLSVWTSAPWTQVESYILLLLFILLAVRLHLFQPNFTPYCYMLLGFSYLLFSLTDSAQPHTSTASLLHTPSPPPSIPHSPVEPEVAGSRRESSNCLYPSKQLAIAITVVLAILVGLLLSGCVLFLLCLRYCHSSYDSKKASEMCELPPIEGTEKGALNLSFDDVTSFTDSQPGLY